MVSRKELKSRAKAQLGGGIFTSRWLTALLVCLVYSAIFGICSLPGSISGVMHNIQSISSGDIANLNIRFSFGSGIGTFLVLLLSGPLTYGKDRMFLTQARDNENLVFADLFKGFTEDLGGNILIGLMTALFAFLWSLLFLIPGIVKAYAYSMVFYIKADHPDYDWKMCINESKRLTMGHKGELFILDLSFFGWYFVGALCFGIGIFWVTPYMEATKAHFYQNLLIADAQTGTMQ